jgi:hypothetical protein
VIMSILVIGKKTFLTEKGYKHLQMVMFLRDSIKTELKLEVTAAMNGAIILNYIFTKEDLKTINFMVEVC